MRKIIFLLCCITVFVFALPSVSKIPLKVSVDMARFRHDSTTLYLELYYSFDVSSLKFIPKDTGFQGDLVFSVMFKKSANDSIIESQSLRIPFSVNDTMLLSTSRNYVDVFGFSLKPDVYRLYVVAKDLNEPAQRDSFSFPVDLRQIEQNQIALSDVELCSSILQIEKDSTNRFYKNTFEVKPNPTKLFGIHQPVLYYYVEAYNLNKNKSENYFTKAVVMNAVGKEIVNHEKIKRRSYESNVEIGTIKVNALKQGSYTFTYTIFDSVDNTKYSASKRFFIYNPTLPLDTLVAGGTSSVLASEYATMSEAELDREFEQARYIAATDEIAQYKKLKGVDSKRKALFTFWDVRDEDKSTPVNEQKQEYVKRLEVSNQQYKTGFKAGWKTDRGRVYILYGAPDEVERHANELDSKPYEIWHYNSIQGGVIFVFGDRTGFSDYILLHSTHRSELHDENWMRQIKGVELGR